MSEPLKVGDKVRITDPNKYPGNKRKASWSDVGTVYDVENGRAAVSWSHKRDDITVHPVSGDPGIEVVKNESVNEMGAGGITGMQLPMGVKQRKKHVDEMMAQHPDLGHGVVLAFLGSLDDQSSEPVCQALDAGDYAGVADQAREHAAREVVRQKMKEVVRKKAGGGGYVLYAPNKGKKGKPRSVGTFPTKLGAKRAELARFPPKDQAKLKRLRKDVDKLSKDPKKAAEKEKQAAKAKGTDKGTKKEAVNTLAGPNPVSNQPAASPNGGISADTKQFMTKLKAIPGAFQKGKKSSPEAQKFIQAHLKDPVFSKKLDPNSTKMLYGLLGSDEKTADIEKKDASGMFKPGQIRQNSQDNRVGNESRQPGSFADLMERKVLAVVVKKALKESLFREEKTDSEWDEYVGKLSKKALAGDSKFQKLQSNISKNTDKILSKAVDSIRKAVGKGVKVKSFDVKHDPQMGETYLPFSIDLDGAVVEPIVVRIEGGVPKIELSSNAKAALTKADPDKVKMLRAELVMVQERVLDEMDDLRKAVGARDKYLQKMEDEVDGYVASLTPLQISLMKKLLVQKYRKTV